MPGQWFGQCSQAACAVLSSVLLRRLVAFVTGLVVLVGCSSGAPDHALPRGALSVVNPNKNNAGIAEGSVRRGEQWVYNLGYPVCTKAGPVRVTSVNPAAPSGDLRVVDWSMGAPADTLGKRGTVKSLVGKVRHPVVQWPCDHKADRRGVITISLTLHSAQAQANGFLVKSSSGTALVPFVVTECTRSKCEPSQ